MDALTRLLTAPARPRTLLPPGRWTWHSATGDGSGGGLVTYRHSSGRLTTRLVGSYSAAKNAPGRVTTANLPGEEF